MHTSCRSRGVCLSHLWHGSAAGSDSERCSSSVYPRQEAAIAPAAASLHQALLHRDDAGRERAELRRMLAVEKCSRREERGAGDAPAPLPEALVSHRALGSEALHSAGPTSDALAKTCPAAGGTAAGVSPPCCAAFGSSLRRTCPFRAHLIASRRMMATCQNAAAPARHSTSSERRGLLAERPRCDFTACCCRGRRESGRRSRRARE